jgi:hypothetical protein
MKLISKLLILSLMTINLSFAEEPAHGHVLRCDADNGPIHSNTDKPGKRRAFNTGFTWRAFKDSVSITLKNKSSDIKDLKISLSMDVEMYRCKKNKDGIYMEKRFKLLETKALGTVYLIGEKNSFKADNFWEIMSIERKDLGKKRAEFSVNFKFRKFLTKNEMDLLIEKRYIMKSIRLSKIDGRSRSFQRMIFLITLSADDTVSMQLI